MEDLNILGFLVFAAVVAYVFKAQIKDLYKKYIK